MTIHTILSLLKQVKQTGLDRWLACCPAHEDHTPSLAIRELDDGRTLIHCFAGCDVQQIVDAIGLPLEELFPPRLTKKHAVKGEARPFPAADILRAVAFEALVVLVYGSAMLAGHSFTEPERQRLMVAVARLQAAVTAGGLTHD